MHDSGTTETEEDNLGYKPVSAEAIPHGQIQKISQEGSKNTYVLILSKDYLKSESSSGQSLLKYSSVSSQSGKSNARKFLSSTTGDYDSPSGQIVVSRKKLLHQPEDVKLNLSNIKDDEYDSNKSSSSVFLQESGFSEQDSVIENDNSSNSIHPGGSASNSNTHSFFCEKSQMNAYVIPTPVTARPKKARVEQHAFKKTSPFKLTEQVSKVGFSSYNSSDKSSQFTAKKVLIATPNQDEGFIGGAKKTTYSNEAVPIMGRSMGSPAQLPSTSLPKTNPKAVPTFSNISPINQQTATQPPQSTFIPISPAESPAYGAMSTGPLTSTPLTGESNRRLQQVRQESSFHRPVYIIPSPFNRPSSNVSSFTNNQNRLDISSPAVQTPSMNNSSGFISASSSLETPDASGSYDGEKPRQFERQYSPMESKEVHSEMLVDNEVTKEIENDRSGGVVITVTEEGEIEELDEGFDSNSLDPSVCSSQDSETSDPVEKAGLNQSLTNIQWLKGMQLKEERSVSQSQSQQYLQWTTLSPEEIAGISKECGATKRPPFSYMGMIQMALHSREDRKMMLKEICKWIEETFPFYKYTAKPGWRNSIRHNLSLYNIFERDGKRHGSYWTIKSNVEPKMKHYPREKHSSDKGSVNLSDTHRSMPTLPSQIPIIPMYSSMGQLSAVSPQTFSNSLQLPQNTISKKKGPPPILPRPTPYSAPQAYALIPIPNVNQSFNTTSPSPVQQQVLLNLSQSGQMSACPSPIISEVSAAVASIQVSSASPIPQEHFCDTKNVQQEHYYNKPMNIVKQAWINCQRSVETVSSVESDRTSQIDITSSSEIASSNDFTGSRSKTKRQRVKPGLPKPTMYKKEERKAKTSSSKRRKLQQKARTVINESSDEDEDGSKFISNIEKEIFSKPFKSLEAEDMEQLLTTSTPAKGLSLSAADLPSPIHGFTPFKGSELFDGSFLETLADRKALGLSPDLGDRKKASHNSPRLGDNPDDFLDFNVLSSPDKLGGSPSQNGNLSTQNLSRILSEYGLDPAIDNSEHFPNLNWSMVDQMVDSMDTT